MVNIVDKKPIYVICVDDEEESLEFMRNSVELMGLTPLTSTTVDGAKALLLKHHLDVGLIISDFKIGPHQTGIELRHATKELWQIPFVIISGYVSREMALEGLACKIDSFFDKPTEQKPFLEHVKKLAANRVSEIEERRIIETTFYAEARDILQDLETQILELEHTDDRKRSLDHIFRLVHTIKGSSAAALSTLEIKNFAHAYEDMLGKLKTEPQLLQTKHIDVLIKGKDTLNVMIEASERGDPIPVPAALDFGLETEVAPRIEEIGDKTPVGQKKGPDKALPKSIRVSAEALDEIEYLTAETTIQRNMISKLLSTILKEIPLNNSVNVLTEHFNEMSKLQSSIQAKVGMVHTVSFAEVVRPLSRIVRDLERQLGKLATINFVGETLRVDHTTEKALADCLVHVVRNAMDHGLEDPATRIAAGKPERGLIQVKAAEDIERYTIRIIDDGKGIDRQKVKGKAIKMGLYTAAELDAMSDEKVLNLIFSAGFSTAEKVTDVSGRGVGTDMVKTTIEGLGGRIQLQSRSGEGTELTLFIPKRNLSLSMVSVLVRVGSVSFAVPQTSIFRLINLDSSRNCQILDVEGGFTLKIDETCVPLVGLQALVNSGSEGGFGSLGSARDVVICTTVSGQIALAIDAILDSEEVVVRPLKDFVNAHHYFKGAALFDDGRVGLVLDPETLGQVIYEHRKAEAGAALTVAHEAEVTLPARSYLLLESLDHQTCAVAEAEVYRIEEVALNQLRISLKQPVIVYRDVITPVQALYLGTGAVTQTDDAPDAKAIFIITQNHIGKFTAHRVKQVIDICDVAAADHFDNPLGGTLGGFLRRERTLYQIISLAPAAPEPQVEKPETNVRTLPLPLPTPEAPAVEAKPVVEAPADVAVGSSWGLFE